MSRFDRADVRSYYDRQTAGFLALGQGGGEGAIHRAVWGPGVSSRADAFHFVDDQIATRLADSTGATHVVDLGCGVGGSLMHLASRLPIRATGVTLSPVQVRIAGERLRASGLAERVSCLEGDFTALPPTLTPAHLAFAIESFVHSPSAPAFFAACARVVAPGGWLAICDDVLRTTADARSGPMVERFRRGWRVNTLLTREQLATHAETAGFVLDSTVDLTPWLELGRPRDRAIALFVALFGWLPLEATRIAHVVGGSALQTCLARGWVGYELNWFRRQPTGHAG